MSRATVWRDVARDVISATSSYSSLSSLGSIPRHADKIHLSIARTSPSYSGTVNVVLHLQRVSDDLWVSMGDNDMLGSSRGSLAADYDIPAGLYDNYGYEVTGSFSSGSLTAALMVRYDADA